MNPAALRVTGALRLSPADSIGVPIFEVGNSMFLPEMDADYNISAFLLYENVDQYDFVRDIPEAYRDRLFRVGDPAPIIFWYMQASQIVEGDAEKTKLQEIFGVKAKTHPVLRDLGEMLDDARTGKIKARQDEWLAREIEVSYNDVFLEEPSRTRYWVSRYRAALENARKLTHPPHPIDVRLRRASSKWLELFATKAEFTMVTSILGEAAQGVYSINQITDIMFAYFSHRLSAANRQEISRWLEDDTVRSLFGRGMYEMYLLDGWPHVPFAYQKPDFLGMLKEKISQGGEKKSWSNARVFSTLILGNRDAPREIDDLALTYIREVLSRLKESVRLAEEFYERKDWRHYEDPLEYAKLVISTHQQAVDLSCIMHGDDRMAGAVREGRFRLDDVDTNRYLRLIEAYRET